MRYTSVFIPSPYMTVYYPSHQLLTRRHELSLRLGVVVPSASKGLTTMLLRELLDTSLKLRSEMSDKTLNRPGKSLTQS
jgi:hypothetical protein